MSRNQEREWIVRMDVKMVGGTMIVTAKTEDEARAKAKALDGDGIDTSRAELVDWSVTDIEPNE